MDDEPEDCSAHGQWPSEARKKRASEPTISYNSTQHLDSSLSGSRNLALADSDLARSGSQHGRSSPSPSRPFAPDPLGLNLVHASPNPILDIIFVHGLGGTSRGTWSWERNPSNFWPPWLLDDSEFSAARIFTFGYNANFSGQYTSLNILDFAKDLLFSMKTYSGDYQQGDVLIGEACFPKFLDHNNVYSYYLIASHYFRSSLYGRSHCQKGVFEHSINKSQSLEEA